MLAPLHILMIEINPAVVEQVMQALQRSSLFLTCHTVTHEQDYTALLSEDLDMIFASSSAPLSCLRALHILQAQQLDVPFVVLADPAHERVALECMQQGAADYMFHDRLLRLSPLVARLVNERHTRRMHDQHAAELSSRQIKRLRALNELSQELVEVGLEREEVLTATARQITATMGDTCAIWLRTTQHHLTLATLSHSASEQLTESQRTLPEQFTFPCSGLVQRVIEQGQPMLLPLVNAQRLAGLMSPEMHTWIEHLDIHSLLLVPLVIDSQMSGMVCACRNTTRHPYTPENQRLLQEIVTQSSLAMTNAHFYDSLQQQYAG